MASEKRMTVKGTGPLSLFAFVKARFPDRIQEWVDALPPASKKIYSGTILAFEMYTLYDALIVPTEKVCDLFFEGNEQGAWETGRHSAVYALKGIYKIFFKLGSPQFIIDRASRVFSNYYPDGELHVAESSPGRVVLQIVKFPEPYRILENDIAGWLDGTLELLDKTGRKVEITKRMSSGDKVTEYIATWQ